MLFNQKLLWEVYIVSVFLNSHTCTWPKWLTAYPFKAPLILVVQLLLGLPPLICDTAGLDLFLTSH